MPSLHEMQRDFSRYLLGGPADRIAAAVLPDRLDPARRAQIYRNHLRISLTEALTATFPVTARLVGPDYFAAAARRFVEALPPRGPVLAEYGEDFPAYLETLPHAPAYIGDVARLEWAMNLSFNAPDIAALSASAIAGADPGGLRLTPHPAARLVVSDYPVHRIWAANQPGADGAADLNEGVVALLIWRRGTDVMFRALEKSEHRFVAALFAGSSLDRAAGLALRTDPLFDLVGTLAALLAEPIFRHPSDQGDMP